jgi:hypothetical protein
MTWRTHRPSRREIALPGTGQAGGACPAGGARLFRSGAILLGVLAIGAFAGLPPALRAARMSPTQALCAM